MLTPPLTHSDTYFSRKKLAWLYLLLSLLLFYQGCRAARFSSFRGEKLHADSTTLTQGKMQAEKFCGTCHLVPQPESMTQHTANYMLAYMGLFLGIDASRQLDDAERAHFRNRYEYLRQSGLIPSQAAISKADWQSLRAYYLALARYPFESSEKASEQNLSPIALPDQGVTLLKRLADGKFAVGGGITGKLFFYDTTLSLLREVNLDSPPVHLVERPEGYYVMTLGSLLGALGENASSSIYFIERQSGKSRMLTRHLPRSAHFVMVDLNRDGKEDFVIAGFGSVTGGGIFACMRQNFTCELKMLSKQNSVVRLAHLATQQNSVQILALAGGAREQVLLIDYAAGIVHETQLLEFPPHLGSVWLEVLDLNNDGEQEILVLSGDNADAGPYNETKPDQGLRIYHFDRGKLVQRRFESLPGSLSLAAIETNGQPALAIARFYTDPSSRQDVTLLIPEKELKFKRRHFSLTSRPVVIAQTAADTLLIGCGNLPVRTLIAGRATMREFTGPALGLMKIPTN